MVLENNGWCPICRVETTFTSNDSWLSENYICKRCNSLPRHRALVAVLDQIAPAWKTMAIHESSPTNPFFTRLCPGYSYSFYFEDIPLGTSKGSIRCENLERLTFEDGTFDIFVTQAVLEHVLDPPSALKEIMRVLREGGIHVFSAPKQKHLTRSYPRAVSEGASVRHLCEPIYHGDPVGDGKTLVTWDYGANFDDLAMLWSGYQTSCYALRNLDMGIAGEYSEIFVTRKKESVRTPDYLAAFLAERGLLDQSPPGIRRGTFDPVSFVRSLYIHILHREPDNEGLAFHVSKLDGGMDPADVVRQFMESPEYSVLRQKSMVHSAPKVANSNMYLKGWRRHVARLIGLLPGT